MSNLAFCFVNSGTASTVLKGSVDSLIAILETRYGPSILEIINNYDGLVQGLIESWYNTAERQGYLAFTWMSLLH